MTRPNLFIVGAPKCGTTAWVSYLSGHPNVFFSRSKEPHFFNTDIPNFRWVKSQQEYLKLFSQSDNKKVIGEASILYLYSQVAAERIVKFNPDAKVLIFVRALERFIPSYHQQLLYNCDEDLTDLSCAWEMSGKRAGDTLPDGCRDPRLLDYKSIGKFGEQAARYLDCFGEDQVRVVRFEDWTADPRSTYVALLGFLNLDDDGRTEFLKINTAHDHRSKAIARLTQRPPRFANRISHTLRSVPGFRNLKPVRLLRKLNRREGYRQPMIDAALLQAIAAHYSEDQHRLEKIEKRVGIFLTKSRQTFEAASWNQTKC